MAKHWYWYTLAGLLLGGCVTEQVDATVAVRSYKVSVVATPGDCSATSEDPCPYSTDPRTFHIDIVALRPDGSLASDYSGTVAVSLQPSGKWAEDMGDVYPMPGGRLVHVVHLEGGEARNVEVSFYSAFGQVQLVAEDLGYEPKVVSNECLSNGTGCPACWTGGASQALAPGCFAQDDDNPNPGSGAVGVSRDLVFGYPRVADLQRVDEFHTEESPLSGFRVRVEGDDPALFQDLSDCVDGQGEIRQLLVVTAVTSSGFFVTDVCNGGGPVHAPDDWSAFASVYAFNFHAPEDLRTGDCITWLEGGQDDFYGFTELKNPAWSDPYCQPDVAGCPPACENLLPDPVELDAATLTDDFAMEKLESGLVALRNVVVGQHRSCDRNGNGQIDFDIQEENDCKKDCERDPDCWVLENYHQYFQFTVDKDGGEMAVVVQGVVAFDPLEHEGETIRYLAGVVKDLSFGGPRWILLPRNSDDFQP